MQKLGYREDKKNIVALLPTNGFNFEKISEKVEFTVWDIGGNQIFGG